MGQQQLLLTIVVTIIVGWGIVAALTSFERGAENSNIDAINMDIVTFASMAQAYYLRPPMYGGGGNTFEGISFRSVAFPAEAYSDDDMMAANSNAIYTLSTPAPGDTVVTITAYPVTGISESSGGGSGGGSEVALQRANSNARIYANLDNSVRQAEVWPNGFSWVE